MNVLHLIGFLTKFVSAGIKAIASIEIFPTPFAMSVVVYHRRRSGFWNDGVVPVLESYFGYCVLLIFYINHRTKDIQYCVRYRSGYLEVLLGTWLGKPRREPQVGTTVFCKGRFGGR